MAANRLEGGIEQLLDEVLGAYFKASDAGQAPERRELLTCYPHLADGLREFFADFDRFESLAAPLRQAGQASTTVAYKGDSAPGENAPVRLPASFGDYDLLEEIGRGGMGVVYKARQRGLNRIVALKMIRGDRLGGAELQRFHNEAEAIAHLDHPHI